MLAVSTNPPTVTAASSGHDWPRTVALLGVSRFGEGFRRHVPHGLWACRNRLVGSTIDTQRQPKVGDLHRNLPDVICIKGEQEHVAECEVAVYYAFGRQRLHPGADLLKH